jgi:hypothetical protein
MKNESKYETKLRYTIELTDSSTLLIQNES